MNHLLAKFFHLTKEIAPDGLLQAQREAIIDLLNLCRIADHKLLPCEEFVEATELGSFSWESKVPLVVYAADSLRRTDLVHRTAEARAVFLKSVADRLGASEMQTHAISVCKELFMADHEFAPQEKMLFREIKQAFGWPDEQADGTLQTGDVLPFDRPIQGQAMA